MTTKLLIQGLIYSSLLITNSFNLPKTDVSKSYPTLDPYTSSVKKLCPPLKFGGLRNFMLRTKDYVNKEELVFNFPIFKSSPMENLYYKFTLTRLDKTVITLKEGSNLASEANRVTDFKVELRINLNDLNERADLDISMSNSINNPFISVLNFPLTSPNLISTSSNKVSVFYGVDYYKEVLEIYEERITFLNCPKIKDTEYYFQIDTTNIVIACQTMSPYNNFVFSTLYFKDKYGYFKKAFSNDLEYPEYLSTPIVKTYVPDNTFQKLCLEGVIYVDPETQMLSNNRNDFVNGKTTKTIFMPVNKYEEYKTLECAIKLTDIGVSKTDIFHTFTINFGNKRIEEASIVSRKDAIQKYTSPLKEVIL